MFEKMPHHEMARSRRDFLTRAGGGFGALALSGLLGAGRSFADGVANPLASKKPHFHARAKSVIFLFMEGGPSHIDSFDPKPLLNKMAGQRIPDSYGKVILPMGEQNSPLLASKRKWKQYGKNGAWISDWLPYTPEIVDDICVVRSCIADGLNHVGSVCQMNTGSTQAGRPSLGAWATYGLGTENENLPSFVVMLDNPKRPHGGVRNWGTGFMPSTYQGTQLYFGAEPIPNLNPPKGLTNERQREKLKLLQTMNRRHAAPRRFQSDLEARINAYELAFRMQAEAPEAVDVGSEPDRVKRMYGLDQKRTKDMAHRCILAPNQRHPFRGLYPDLEPFVVIGTIPNGPAIDPARRLDVKHLVPPGGSPQVHHEQPVQDHVDLFDPVQGPPVHQDLGRHHGSNGGYVDQSPASEGLLVQTGWTGDQLPPRPPIGLEAEVVGQQAVQLLVIALDRRPKEPVHHGLDRLAGGPTGAEHSIPAEADQNRVEPRATGWGLPHQVVLFGSAESQVRWRRHIFHRTACRQAQHVHHCVAAGIPQGQLHQVAIAVPPEPRQGHQFALQALTLAELQESRNRVGNLVVGLARGG